MLVVEMLSTGDEVLHGQIIDTNAAWLADYFFQHGIPMRFRSTVGDNLDDLISTLRLRSQYADILIVNGGLGPTSDDLSTLAAAKALDEELVGHTEWIDRMVAYFAARGREMSANNRKQAMLPASAELVDNPIGTACGFMIKLNNCLIFFTPGVPSEFKVMVNDQIMPRLSQHFDIPERPLCLRLTSFGRTESGLAQGFDSLSLPEGCVLGYRSSMPVIEIKLTGPEAKRDEMQAVWERVKAQVGDNLIFEGTEGLASYISRHLIRRGMTVALYEQFTAGLLSWQLNSSNAPISGGIIQPQQAVTPMVLTSILQRMVDVHPAQIAIGVGCMDEQGQFSIGLLVPEKVYVLSFRYQPQHHSIQIQQEVVAMLGLDMLRLWMNKGSPIGQYEWLESLGVYQLEN